MDFDNFFESGDEFLEGGGQVGGDGIGLALEAADAAPIFGEVLEAAQAEYHGLHAVNDFKNGHYADAAQEEMEAAWHAVGALPGAHEALAIPHYLEAGSDALDLITGGDVPLVPQTGNPFTGYPLVSPLMKAVGHYAD